MRLPAEGQRECEGNHSRLQAGGLGPSAGLLLPPCNIHFRERKPAHLPGPGQAHEEAAPLFVPDAQDEEPEWLV